MKGYYGCGCLRGENLPQGSEKELKGCSLLDHGDVEGNGVAIDGKNHSLTLGVDIHLAHFGLHGHVRHLLIRLGLLGGGNRSGLLATTRSIPLLRLLHLLLEDFSPLFLLLVFLGDILLLNALPLLWKYLHNLFFALILLLFSFGLRVLFLGLLLWLGFRGTFLVPLAELDLLRLIVLILSAKRK